MSEARLIACDVVHRRGRWICLTHDCEVDQLLVVAYITNPGPDDFECPIEATS